jgi:hypothetical protein
MRKEEKMIVSSRTFYFSKWEDASVKEYLWDWFDNNNFEGKKCTIRVSVEVSNKEDEEDDIRFQAF